LKQIKLTKSTTELFLTDFHFPTEDKKVFSLALQVARAINPDILYLNGDMVDFGSISSFLTAPNKRLSLSSDIKYAIKRLHELKLACPDAQIFYKEGNHCQRMQRYLSARAPELSGLEDIELPKLLHLNDINATWVENDEKLRIGELYHLHGNEIATGLTYPARVMLSKVNTNAIFGHTHRFSVAYQNDLSGKVHVCWNIGCGQKLDVDYIFHPAWQQGFALVEYTKGGLFHVNPIEVFKVGSGKGCMLYGRLYSA